MKNYVDRIKPDSYGITTYLENLRRGQYQIPTFQRDVVWNRDRVKRLWDSIYKFYPLAASWCGGQKRDSRTTAKSAGIPFMTSLRDTSSSTCSMVSSARPPC